MSVHDYNGFSFSDPANRFLTSYKSRKSEGSYQSRKTDLKAFEEWFGGDPTGASWSDLDGYITSLANFAPNTIEGRYDTLSVFYGYLEKSGAVGPNPWDKMERSDYRNLMNGSMKDDATNGGTLPSITPKEKELLIEHVPKPKTRNRLALRLMWHGALRQGELANIKLDDVDREARTIYIAPMKTAKGRTVSYAPGAVDRLMDQWLDYGGRSSSLYADESPYLLLTYQSKKISNYLNKTVKGAADNAGIQEPMNIEDGEPVRDQNGHVRWRITSHAFRHGAALEYLKGGMNIRELQKYLGHEKLDTTMIYLDMLDDEVVESAQRVGQASDSFG